MNTERIARLARKEELRARGITVRKPTYVWRVEPSVIAIPSWAQQRAIKGLSTARHYVWLRRRDAWYLSKMDREDGGQPCVVRVEIRTCQICKRILLGDLAEQRRKLDESCMTGDQLPCSPDCLGKHWRDKG